MGVQHFPGGPNLFQGGRTFSRGLGVQMLILETHRTCDFPGGEWEPSILLPSGSAHVSFKLLVIDRPVKYFTDRSKAVLLLWIFYVFVLSCVCYVLCASVYMCFVVTCWERADLLALVCGVFCEFVTFPLVSWVRCGT